MDAWIKGMDLSTLLEVEECGGTFSDHGVPGGAMEILQGYGMIRVRRRRGNHPHCETVEPYGAVTNDLPRTMSLARRAKALGLGWLLDFHYSDFWADPGKQTIPKAWRGLDEAGLADAVYTYTRDVLRTLDEAGLMPDMVAVGNELTKGLLWPYGKTPNFGAIVRFLNSGIRAVREADKTIPVMLHLDNGGNNAMYRAWFDSYFAHGGADFEYIGLSYYPFWHGTLQDLETNMNDISVRYRKNLILTEVSTAFTMEEYQAYEQLPDALRKGMATTPALVEPVPYPMSPEGQSAFLEDIMELIRAVPEGRGKGFFYWEPAWLPVPGSGWANDAALAYTGERGPGGNEWANQALFDYEGRALPALETIRNFQA